MEMDIRCLDRSQVDDGKWNHRVATSGNGLIYSTSAFLDCFAPGWIALVADDYEFVMALPARAKFGISYLYQPFLVPELGVIGEHTDANIVNQFLSHIPASYKLWDISLNRWNIYDGGFGRRISRRNYSIDLSAGYETLQQQFSSKTRNKISGAKHAGCRFSDHADVDDLVNICHRKFAGFRSVQRAAFDGAATYLKRNPEYSKIVSVSAPDGTILSIAAFLLDGRRVYYWLAGNTPESKHFKSSPMLIDAVIHMFAGQSLIFDFEGSDVPSIATFFKNFGSTEESFDTIFYNRLPLPFRFFKPLPQHYREVLQQSSQKC